MRPAFAWLLAPLAPLFFKPPRPHVRGGSWAIPQTDRPDPFYPACVLLFLFFGKLILLTDLIQFKSTKYSW
jgi:hypothetical protein